MVQRENQEWLKILLDGYRDNPRRQKFLSGTSVKKGDYRMKERPSRRAVVIPDLATDDLFKFFLLFKLF